jgi:hypothetical protein
MIPVESLTSSEGSVWVTALSRFIFELLYFDRRILEMKVLARGSDQIRLWFAWLTRRHESGWYAYPGDIFRSSSNREHLLV